MTDSPEQLGDFIVSIYKELKSKTEKELKPHGIGMGQLHILMLFYARPNSRFSQNDLVKQLNIDKGNISRNVKKLMEKNYLEQADDHTKNYHLSEQGNEIKKEIMTAFMFLHQGMTKGIPQNELQRTVQVLSKIAKNMEGLE
ncbi:MAG: MarR family winged helix-turn-helix transcriptional regulator [Bacillota bacterium]|nr:MarR family winged helix-turn-helix transcriptional regulator [Bacillota bacterium]MDW7678131.1 MarR family winged helix-turn-helix transcriptional regulator [Bacillota bacterium]